MDKDTIKIIRAMGGKKGRSKAEIVKRKNATRFIWMPGIRPVIVPIVMPKTNAKANSSIILYSRIED
jgi:hypothetical protein